MEIDRGERVLVNLSAFTGSAARSRQLIPCDVLAVDGQRVRVATSAPYRDLVLWVRADWVEGKPSEDDGDRSFAGHHFQAAAARRSAVYS